MVVLGGWAVSCERGTDSLRLWTGSGDALTSAPDAHSVEYSSQFKNNHFTEMCCGTEKGSYLRLIDSCITQRKAQGPSRTCDESTEEHLTHTRSRGCDRTCTVLKVKGLFLPRVCEHIKDNQVTPSCSYLPYMGTSLIRPPPPPRITIGP